MHSVRTLDAVNFAHPPYQAIAFRRKSRPIPSKDDYRAGWSLYRVKLSSESVISETQSDQNTFLFPDINMFCSEHTEQQSQTHPRHVCLFVA